MAEGETRSRAFVRQSEPLAYARCLEHPLFAPWAQLLLDYVGLPPARKCSTWPAARLRSGGSPTASNGRGTNRRDRVVSSSYRAYSDATRYTCAEEAGRGAASRGDLYGRSGTSE